MLNINIYKPAKETFKRIVVSPKKSEIMPLEKKVSIRVTAEDRFRDSVFDGYSTSSRSLSRASDKVKTELVKTNKELDRVVSARDNYKKSVKNLESTIDRKLYELNDTESRFGKRNKASSASRPSSTRAAAASSIRVNFL